MPSNTEKITPQIVVSQLTDTHGVFTLSPLLPGFGITYGSALRRTLFAAEEGYAISQVKIHPTVPHEFAAIDGIKEDLQGIILNLKQVRFKKIAEKSEGKILVSLKDSETFKGRDITQSSSSFEVLNPELVICHIEKDVNLEIELTVSKGRGYEPAEEHKPEEQIYGLFPIDAIYAPIKNVTIDIQNILVGKRTDYEKLHITITTDGSVSPEQALKNTARLLKNTFAIIDSDKIVSTEDIDHNVEEPQKKKIRIEQLLQTPLSQLGLPARLVNSLGAHSIEYLKDIVGKRVSDLLLLPNFGKKCLQDLEAFLKEKNISWDADIANKK